MIRKNIKLKKLFYNILVITSFIVTFLVFLQKIPNSSFIKYENYNIDEVISQNEKYDTKSLNNITTVLNDLLEGYTGEGYNLEEEYYSNVVSRSMDSIKLCDDHCSSHGPGHENGGINLLDTGCRNYMGWSYGNYGSLSIPIWINMNSMNTITDITHRNTLINDIRYQISLWNSVQMHDGSGTLVYLYEVGIGESTRPNNINGKKVVEILRKDGQYSGQFDPNNLQIRINYSYSSYNDRGGRNVDTPLHEMGHLLGLMDLEAGGSGIAKGTHKTLMGYNRGTTINTIDKAIKYQDIQGVAVFNNIHTEHKFDRFVLKNGRYLNICFYCDRIDSTISAKSGVLEMQSEKTCVHDFQPLVSCADNHWFKCTKCYKVIESDYYFNVEGTSTSRTIKILGPVNNSIQIANIPNKIIDINVTSIGADAFKNCKNLQKVVIPNTITNIDSSTFENCSYLQSVTLPTNLVAIGSSAFKGCGSLATITIPNGVTHIDSSAFENCSYLQSVTLPTNLVTIGSSAFKGCGSLGNITIPNSVTNIDSSAFENCSYLQTIILSSNLNEIGVSAFKGCGSLGSIKIPSNVQYIDDSAFENCVSLVSVVVERGISNITNLGNYAFAGCSSTLQIIVPKNRLAEYKNKFYWSSYKNNIIPDSTDFDELNLHCLVDDSSDVTLSAGYNELYKLNVECNKSYKFMTSSGIELKVYDEYFDELYTGENTLYAYLSPGTYYLDVRYNSSTASGTITIDYELRWTHDGERVYYNDEHNLLTHLHETSDCTYFNKLYYTNNNGAGFYKFQLNGTYSNNLPIVYDSGMLTIYNDSGRLETQVLNRYPNSSIMASSDDNQDTMYVYLPRNGYFYINVVMPSESYESLSLTVSPISSQNINLFNLNENANHLISVLNNTDKGDYVETLNVEQTGKFTISYNYNGSSTDNFVFLLVKQNYNSTTNQYSFSTIINKTMNATNNSFTYTGNLEAGKYYIGYLNKNDNSSVVANFVRLVTDSNNQKLLPDPDMSTVYGSEVRFNNGVCRGTNLTVGFTRFIYLDNTLDIRSQSRLDYYWYSSDENVASISDYGTLLGLSPGIVKIMAVYKNDPSVVYVKQFTVLPDTRTEDLVVEISESITYAESGQIYEISLTDTNSPYPLNSLYEWSVVLDESSYSVTVTEWGTFSMSGTGTIVLEGRSKLNPHLVVRFTLIVT